MEMVYSLCIWEGDLFGATAAPSQSDWAYGTMYPQLWSGLPKEVLEMILLKMIPDSSKCRFRAVSRHWRQLLSSAEAFKKAVPSCPKLLCKLYPHPKGAAHRHSQSWKPYKGKGVKVTRAELQRASVITCGSDHVSRDCTVHLSGLPKFDVTCDNSILQDGLLLIVPHSRLFEPHNADVCVINPMNRTWKLLPKCDDSIIPNIELKYFHMSVVVSRPPGCTFHVFVRGNEEKSGGTKHVLRYSSESNSWVAFTGDEVVVEQFNYTGLDQNHFALSSTLLYAVNHKEGTLYMYHAEEDGRSLSMFKALRFPACRPDGDVVGVVSHLGKTYLFGEQEVRLSFLCEKHCLAVWELDPVKDTWVLISVAPDELLVDFRSLFPGQNMVPWIHDYTVADGMLAIAVSLTVLWEDESDEFGMPPYPNQYVYFRFGDKSWYSGSRFFCSNSLKDYAGSSGIHLDNEHFLFEPRLDIRLGE